MYLSFFIYGNSPILDEIEDVLVYAGFENIVRFGEVDPHRIVIFNGKKSNQFSYSGHKLINQAPQELQECPFLVRAGSKWTVHGLIQILENYVHFAFPYFSSIHFPEKEDFQKEATNEDFMMRIKGMKRSLVHCESTPKSQIDKFQGIIEQANGKSVAQVKREIFYFFMEEKRLTLPWGDPPTSRSSRNKLIKWLKKANKSFPRNRSGFDQARRDLNKIKKLEDIRLAKPT